MGWEKERGRGRGNVLVHKRFFFFFPLFLIGYENSRISSIRLLEWSDIRYPAFRIAISGKISIRCIPIKHQYDEWRSALVTIFYEGRSLELVKVMTHYCSVTENKKWLSEVAVLRFSDDGDGLFLFALFFSFFSVAQLTMSAWTRVGSKRVDE